VWKHSYVEIQVSTGVTFIGKVDAVDRFLVVVKNNEGIIYIILSHIVSFRSIDPPIKSLALGDY
jgi:sRNA-binding regulator protein Hfq